MPRRTLRKPFATANTRATENLKNYRRGREELPQRTTEKFRIDDVYKNLNDRCALRTRGRDALVTAGETPALRIHSPTDLQELPERIVVGIG